MKIGKKISIYFFILIMAAKVFAMEPFDPDQIDEIIGLKGKFVGSKSVYKISMPRTDVKVSVDHWPMPTFMGLTSWAAFQKGKPMNFMVMGDFVLFEDEVNAVMSAALEHDLEVTALHHHLFSDNPRVYFMHIGGENNIEHLAQGVRSLLDAIKKIRTINPQPVHAFGNSKVPVPSSITAAALEKIFETSGEKKDGMFKVVFGRSSKMPCGCVVGTEMGVNTWAAFAGRDDNAVVNGDFSVQAAELQAILKILRESHIHIVAIHNHMIEEEPRLFFVHYWGRGKAEDLAKALKLALQKTQTNPEK